MLEDAAVDVVTLPSEGIAEVPGTVDAPPNSLQDNTACITITNYNYNCKLL